MSCQMNTGDNTSGSSENLSNIVNQDDRRKRISKARLFMHRLHKLAKKPVSCVTLSKPVVEPAVTLNVNCFNEILKSSSTPVLSNSFNTTLLDSLDDVYLFQSRLKETLKDNYQNYNQLLCDWFSAKIENHEEFSQKLHKCLPKNVLPLHNQYIHAIICRVHSEETSLLENFATFADKLVRHPEPKPLALSDPNESPLFEDEFDDEEEELIITKTKRKVKPISDDEDEEETNEMKEEDEDDDFIMPVRRKRKVRCIESDEEDELDSRPNLSNFISKEVKLKVESCGSLKIKIGRSIDGAETYAFQNDRLVDSDISNYHHSCSSLEEENATMSYDDDERQVSEVEASCDNAGTNTPVNSSDIDWFDSLDIADLMKLYNTGTVDDALLCDTNQSNEEQANLSSHQLLNRNCSKEEERAMQKDDNRISFPLPEGQVILDNSDCKLIVDSALLNKMCQNSNGHFCFTNGEDAKLVPSESDHFGLGSNGNSLLYDRLKGKADSISVPNVKNSSNSKRILIHISLENGIFVDVDGNVRFKVRTFEKNDSKVNENGQVKGHKKSLDEANTKVVSPNVPSNSEMAEDKKPEKEEEKEKKLSEKRTKISVNLVDIVQRFGLTCIEEEVVDLCKTALENFIRNLLASTITLQSSKHRRSCKAIKCDKTSHESRCTCSKCQNIPNLRNSRDLACWTKSSLNMPVSSVNGEFEENIRIRNEKKCNLDHLFDALQHDRSLIPVHHVWNKAFYRIISTFKTTGQ